MRPFFRWMWGVVLLLLAGTAGTGMWLGGEMVSPPRRSLEPHHHEVPVCR